MAEQCFRCSTSAFTSITFDRFLCRNCYSYRIEKKVSQTIRKFKMIDYGDHIAIGVSGGKDSVVLLYILNKITKKFNNKLTVVIIDEGVATYRYQGISIAVSHAKKLNLSYKIYSYEELFGKCLDEMVKLKPFGKSSCAICGTFRRKALNYAALDLNADLLATGHNLDDEAQTILLNLLRGDINRLLRTNYSPVKIHKKFIPRIKPLIHVFQPEVVYYALANNLEFHDEECPYAHEARRNLTKTFLFEQEKKHNGTLTNILRIQEEISARFKPIGTARTDFIECINCGDLTDDIEEFLCAGCKFRNELSKLDHLPIE